tara:strand:- start:96 stop:875 length:780 start_codon:yes stop_codon:yes gene_type:complete
MKNKLNITLIQSHIYWEDVDSNLKNLDKILKEINNTDIILLPEMFNTAFSPGSFHLAETMKGKTIKWLLEMSQKKKSAIAGTLMIKEKGKVYNRLIWVSKKGIIYKYDKSHLFTLAKEHKHLTKGEHRIIIEEEGWKICPLICYDLRFPVFSRNNIEYDILIYLANWPVRRIKAWDTLLKARSIENQCFTIGVNRIGKDNNEIEFNGHSSVYDSVGDQLIFSESNTTSVLKIKLESKKLQLRRRQMPFLKDQDKFSINY